MVYDAIIIGAGPSGAASAICMQHAKRKCLILEKQIQIGEKTCGGFLSSGAVKALQSIGLQAEELLEMGAAPIHNFVYIRNDKSYVIPYHADEYGLGITRHLLDSWLFDHAIKAGAKVQFGEHVKSIVTKNDIFQVNGYLSSNVIIASGASGFIPQEMHTVFSNQTFGLSAQITGITNLSIENVYFYITGGNGLDYFWIIPNGNNIWNIGIWFQKMPKDAVSQFWLYKENFVDPLFSKTEFIRKLKGAYCGNYSLFNQFPHGCYTVGDAGGFNSPTTGAGLRAAITSAIDVVNAINAS